MQIMNQYHQNPGKSIDATQINHLWELFGSGQAELPQNPCLGFWNIGFTRKVSRLNLQAYLFLSFCSWHIFHFQYPPAIKHGLPENLQLCDCQCFPMIFISLPYICPIAFPICSQLSRPASCAMSGLSQPGRWVRSCVARNPPCSGPKRCPGGVSRVSLWFPVSALNSELVGDTSFVNPGE